MGWMHLLAYSAGVHTRIGPESGDDFVVFPIFNKLLGLERVIIIYRLRIWSKGDIFFLRVSLLPSNKLAQFARKKL
jgi:hypothetical protein